ncbi:MAG TPA: LD-carboxypeptidase [Thermoanaerobaculia bacterium]|nr:LD-carboxypeptidase [Thermoanaerobaculia bacterium]
MKSLVRPRRLRPGATIGIPAVSGPVDGEKIDRGIAILGARGYRVREASNLRSRAGFLAGSDEERAAGYRELIRDPEVEAVCFARGGYGSSRILPHLDAEEVRANPKIHLGGSDLTVLFAYLGKRAGLVTFYGPMVAVEMGKEDDLDWERVLRGAAPDPHRFADADVIAAGRTEGVLVGGCLSLLASLAGTPEALDGEGSILFWEDTGEETYRLDRMLTQLERSGTFDRLRGMVIGSVSPGARSESPQEIAAYLRERLRGSPFPVAMGLPAGHLERPRTIPLGVRVRLDLQGEASLTFLESGVR